MLSRTKRRIVEALVLGTFIVLAIHRLQDPFPYTVPALLLAGGITSLFVANLMLIRRIDPHQINLGQKKRYSITWRSSILTTLVTGVATAAMLFAANTVYEQLTSYVGHEFLSAIILQEAVQRMVGVTAATASTLIGGYVLLSILLGTGFWLLYPYIPGEDEELAAPVAFVLAWTYILFGTTLIMDVGILNPVTLVIDAALIAVWGKFFALAYERVESYLL